MKKTYSALLAAALCIACTPLAMSATPPPGTPMKAICGGAGFMPSPATYTQADLDSGLGAIYTCSKPWTGPRPPYFQSFMKCSSKFDPGSPSVKNGKATYICKSQGHIK